jgi:hypothetical protein
MSKEQKANIVTALCTACAMIAFAFYKRYATSFAISSTALFVAAAVVCLAPALYGLVRCRSRTN